MTFSLSDKLALKLKNVDERVKKLTGQHEENALQKLQHRVKKARRVLNRSKTKRESWMVMLDKQRKKHKNRIKILKKRRKLLTVFLERHFQEFMENCDFQVEVCRLSDSMYVQSFLFFFSVCSCVVMAVNSDLTVASTSSA